MGFSTARGTTGSLMLKPTRRLEAGAGSRIIWLERCSRSLPRNASQDAFAFSDRSAAYSRPCRINAKARRCKRQMNCERRSGLRRGRQKPPLAGWPCRLRANPVGLAALVISAMRQTFQGERLTYITGVSLKQASAVIRIRYLLHEEGPHSRV